MANYTFTATFTGSASATVAKARGAIEGAGGTFTGDDAQGKFVVSTPMGDVKGNYTVSAQSFTVEITQKPFLLPGSTIETNVRGFLA